MTHHPTAPTASSLNEAGKRLEQPPFLRCESIIVEESFSLAYVESIKS